MAAINWVREIGTPDFAEKSGCTANLISHCEYRPSEAAEISFLLIGRDLSSTFLKPLANERDVVWCNGDEVLVAQFFCSYRDGFGRRSATPNPL
jgi:hypothetical protein